MSTMITINVTNNNSTVQNFFFFQHPAQYGGGAHVYTNSLFASALLPHASSGSMLSFMMVEQNYACVQQQTSPPQVGQRSGQQTESRAIGVAGGAPNTTTMTVSPLGLSVPVPVPGVQPGSFRIVTPTFNPSSASYNAGSGVQTLQGGVILSSFVAAYPSQNIDCQPVLKFYVQTGSYSPGTVLNFTSSSINAALCDAASGHKTFNVTYNADGTWSVRMLASVQGADGQPMPVAD